MNYEYPCPMKIFDTTNKDLINAALESDEYIAQRKLDGSSYTLLKDETGTAHLYSGGISKKDGFPIDKIDSVPQIKRFIENFFRNGSSMVAEIYSYIDYSTGVEYERELSKLTNTIMLCNSDKAIARQEKYGPIRCYVFDILEWNCEDMAKLPFSQRDAMLDELFETFPAYEWLSKAETIAENKAEFLAGVIAEGGEGVVLKKLSAPHPVVEIGQTPKRPSHSTYKVKTVATRDVVIVGITLPEKEYKGKDPENYKYRDEDGNPVNRLWALNMINALVIGAYDTDGGLRTIGSVSSGLDDEIRTAVYKNPGEFIGTVIEVSCMSVDNAAHSLRHPRLVRFREDKAAEGCTMESIFV